MAAYLLQRAPDQTGSEAALDSLRREAKLLKSLSDKAERLKKELDALKERKETRSDLVRHGQATPEILKELGSGDALRKAIDAAEKLHASATEAQCNQGMEVLEQFRLL